MARSICLLLALTSCAILAPFVSGQDDSQKVDKCSTVKCAYGANCRVSETGQTQCVCPSACPQYVKPICGSDGVTYGNACFMKVSACKAKKNVTQISDRACPKDAKAPNEC